MFVVMMVLWGCSEKIEDTEQEPAIVEEYYQASTVIVLEESGMQFDEGYWIRRTHNEINSEILEEFFSSIDGTLTMVTFDVDVEKQSFTLLFSDENLTGTGSFVGEGLLWSSWESTSTHTDGTSVFSEDSKDGQGHIYSSKIGYSVDGAVDWRLDEEWTPIAQEVFDQEVEALLE